MSRTLVKIEIREGPKLTCEAVAAKHFENLFQDRPREEETVLPEMFEHEAATVAVKG